jgi:hypothetical protein
MSSSWELLYQVEGTVVSWKPCDCPECVREKHYERTEAVCLEIQAHHDDDARKFAKRMLDHQYGRQARVWIWERGPEITLIGEVPEDQRMKQVGAPRLFEVCVGQEKKRDV